MSLQENETIKDMKLRDFNDFLKAFIQTLEEFTMGSRTQGTPLGFEALTMAISGHPTEDESLADTVNNISNSLDDVAHALNEIAEAIKSHG